MPSRDELRLCDPPTMNDSPAEIIRCGNDVLTLENRGRASGMGGRARDARGTVFHATLVSTDCISVTRSIGPAPLGHRSSIVSTGRMQTNFSARDMGPEKTRSSGIADSERGWGIELGAERMVMRSRRGAVQEEGEESERVPEIHADGQVAEVERAQLIGCGGILRVEYGTKVTIGRTISTPYQERSRESARGGLINPPAVGSSIVWPIDDGGVESVRQWSFRSPEETLWNQWKGKVVQASVEQRSSAVRIIGGGLNNTERD
ncbi:hypothetical protein B0H17DRAFT_1174318 [Mycena rosella]|uniref:Uncharacterized protein n=1 Tax=Mycena rosella TaxID=1033263 RepID=A0AAD7GYQ9_MYCRO|nr:hypothetical protein B0H17DRAFT_1174318 [Mycena rosella]